MTEFKESCPECDISTFITDGWSSEKVALERARVAAWSEERLEASSCDRHRAQLRSFYAWAHPMYEETRQVTGSRVFLRPR